ncbi:MAG: cryptochrome/photolyase family protein [Ignavibacteriaceae bacterium]|nr:cryptochrome/photolyase family protein [Ignavibacteriaceae bacterium]
MTETVTLVFPHQLFENNPAIRKDNDIILFEDPLFFRQFKFHKKKLVFHRASMKFYESYLTSRKYSVLYYDTISWPSLKSLFTELSGKGVKAVRFCEVSDYLLEKRLSRYSAEFSIKLLQETSPLFISEADEVRETLKSANRYFMASFYINRRKNFNILIEGNQPFGGKWSFDTENRKKIPAGVEIPKHYTSPQNKFIKEAQTWVDENFYDNPGEVKPFFYPVTFNDSVHAMNRFFTERFADYGAYQDAIESSKNFLFHSILSPMLNNGLLNPLRLVQEAVAYGLENNIPVNSLEGFVRQILGWREFMRGVYLLEGTTQRTANSFDHRNEMPASFYDGTTGIRPFDEAVKRVIDTGYTHHIERLMILGNFMHLCELHPDRVYQWFMELFIDAYDWVMVPNVYGMSLYSDGGLITTKPYVSGSNYILKMSNYKKADWCDKWDALYWRYIYKNREAFRENQRMSMIVSLVDNMNGSTLRKHLETAEDYLSDFNHV